MAKRAEKRAVAVVPARGGSVGVPRKNLADVGGRPLVAHTLALALSHPLIETVYLSTDDREIADVGRSLGAEVPGLRPAELAADDVPLLPVVQDVLRRVEPRPPLDTVVLLQPTNPFRLADDVTRALERLWEREPDCVLSVSPCREHPFRTRLLDADGAPVPVVDDPRVYAQRQELPAAYRFCGSVVAAPVKRLQAQRTFFGERQQAVAVDALSGFDIDTLLDLELARVLAQWLGGPPFDRRTPEREAVLRRM